MLFRRCCCRQVEDQVDSRTTGGRRRRHGSPRASNKKGGPNEGDNDDDSDVQAVKWLRDRTKRNSKDAADEWLEQQEQEQRNGGSSSPSSRNKKSKPSSAMRKKSDHMPSSPTSTSSPIDTDGLMDVEEAIPDDTSLAELRMDKQVSIENAEDDVDPEVKERYDKAVSLLHRAMLEKQKSLTSTERSFLTHLLDSPVEQEQEERLSAIENATQTLAEDPLFDAPAPPSPSRTAQQVSPPRRPSYHGVKLSVAKPLHSTSGEAFELTICGSGSMDDESSMDIDEQDDDLTPPVLITEDDDAEPVSQRDGYPTSVEQALVRYSSWEDEESEDSRLPFYVLGQSSANRPHVLTPLILEALRGFLPFVVSEANFWLKFSMIRDGASLATLLHLVRASKWTIIGVETMEGEVFGSCTDTPWRKNKGWYGTGEAFLWRLKNSRLSSPAEASGRSSNFDRQMEVYPYTGADDLVQLCTGTSLAVGGGDWGEQKCPYEDEPTGIGLMVDQDLAFGETSSCATFANPRLCGRSKTSNDFHISNMEVWTLTPCISVEEAEKLELHKLFVEEQRLQ